MTPGTIIVLIILAIIVFFAVRSLMKDKKAGKHLCGGNCSACGGCSCGSHLSDEEILEMAKKAANEK